MSGILLQALLHYNKTVCDTIQLRIQHARGPFLFFIKIHRVSQKWGQCSVKAVITHAGQIFSYAVFLVLLFYSLILRCQQAAVEKKTNSVARFFYHPKSKYIGHKCTSGTEPCKQVYWGSSERKMVSQMASSRFLKATPEGKLMTKGVNLFHDLTIRTGEVAFRRARYTERWRYFISWPRRWEQDGRVKTTSCGRSYVPWKIP